MRRGLSATLAAGLALVALPAGAAARAPYRAGAAVVPIPPPVAVYAGGFSLSPPIKREHDPLAVRALYVSDGRHAVGLATVDAQGYFAAYEEGPGFGTTADRAAAAKALSKLGPRVAPGDLIVQATHTHAGPTLEGIWGPVPLPYLRAVHAAVVRAFTLAARRARPAVLTAGTADASQLDTQVIDTDSYPGWGIDGRLNVLRALDPRTGATLVTYASVPVHGAHVCGQCDRILSADYFGLVARDLQQRLGGVAVVGPATLGRQESPVEVTDFPTLSWFARIVSGYATQAAAAARPVTGPVLGTQRFVRFPATNGALLALNRLWTESDAQKAQFAQQTGLYPIDRSLSAPYTSGNTLGTWLTAVRIGSLLYLSMPGEPFPELAHSLRLHVAGVRAITLLSKGQDDFGYFWPAWVTPFIATYGDDHAIFNVSQAVGDTFVDAQLDNAAALGLKATKPTGREPLPYDLGQNAKPGLQALASPPAGDAGPGGRFTATLEAIYAPPVETDSQAAGKVRWDFGDGTRVQSGYLLNSQNFGATNVGPHGAVRIRHAFRPRARPYTVRAQITDEAGDTATWSFPVQAHPRLRVAIVRRGARFVARVRGGDGHVLAERWSRRGQAVRVSVTDGTGTVATAIRRSMRTVT